MNLLDTYLGGLAVVLLSSGLAVLGLLLSRKFLDVEKLQASHEVGGYLLSVAGTLYAVLLGLVVVDSMQKFQEARDITEREANSLADVFVLSMSLPEKKRQEVRQLCRQYVDQVLGVEWCSLGNGKECPVARGTAVEIMKTLVDFEPQTENQKAIYPQLINEATQIWQCRRNRTNAAKHGVPLPEWITLIVGGIVTVFFTYLFGLKTLKMQIVMTVMVTTLISLNIVLVVFFAYPFSGDLNISSQAFEIDRAIFENRMQELK